jgi:hypothetical protein
VKGAFVVVKRDSTGKQLDEAEKRERGHLIAGSLLVGLPLAGLFAFFTISQPIGRDDVQVTVQRWQPIYPPELPPYLSLDVRLPDGRLVVAQSYNRPYPKFGDTITVERRRYLFGAQTYFWK